jgi:hypothetical protein
MTNETYKITRQLGDALALSITEIGREAKNLYNSCRNVTPIKTILAKEFKIKKNIIFFVQ